MNYFQLVIALLKGTPLEPFAVKLQADLADGKINAGEVPGLIESLGPAAQAFFPKNAAEAGLAIDVAAAVDKYMALKKAEPLAPVNIVVAAAPAKLIPR